MSVIQLTVFIENKSGRLLSVTKLLAENNINVRSMCVADTSEYGLVRFIVDNPEKAKEVLNKNAISVRSTEIIAIELEDDPGGLSKVLSVFADKCINIEYLYAFTGGPAGKAIVGFKVDSDVAQVLEELSETDLKILHGTDIYNI